MCKSANGFVVLGLMALLLASSGQIFSARADEKASLFDLTLTSTTLSGGEAPWSAPTPVVVPEGSLFNFPNAEAGFSASSISVVPEPTIMSLAVLAAFTSVAFRKRNNPSR